MSTVGCLMEETPSLAAVGMRLRDAVGCGDVAAVVDLMAGDVTWVDCRGRRDAQQYLATLISDHVTPTDVSVEVVDDRLVSALRLATDGPLIYQSLFVADGEIVEIRGAADAEQAARQRPVGNLADAAARSSTVERAVAVLPVRDIATATTHYRLLGFTVRAYEGDAPYAYASRAAVEVHLTESADLEPARNSSALYLYVGDADAQYAQWRLTGVEGRLIAPVDTEYGLREGAHVDPDGNLLRFGSPLPA